MGFLLCRYQALVSTGLQQSANSAMNFTSSEEVKNVLSEAFALQSQSSSSSRRRRLQQTSEEDLEALADVSAVVADEIETSSQSSGEGDSASDVTSMVQDITQVRHTVLSHPSSLSHIRSEK